MLLIILLLSHYIMGTQALDRNKSPNLTAQFRKQTKLSDVTSEAVTWSYIGTKMKELTNLTSVAGTSSKVTSKIGTFTTKIGKMSNTKLNTGKLSNTETNDALFSNVATKSEYDRFYFNLSICDVMSTNRYVKTDKDETFGILEYLLQEQVACQVEYTVHISSPVGTILNLKFTYFRTRHCTDQCLCDSLKMYDVVNDTIQERDSFCGFRETWSVLSKSNHVILQLTLMNGSESYHTLFL